MLASSDIWKDDDDAENRRSYVGVSKGSINRNDFSVKRSPTKNVPKRVDHQYYYQSYRKNRRYIQKSFKTENFFPESPIKCSSLPSYSIDPIDGVFGREHSCFGTSKNREHRNSIGETAIYKLALSSSLDESEDVKAFELGVKLNEADISFSDSSESENMIFACSSIEKLNESLSEETKYRLGKMKGAKQKQLENDDQDSDTKIYGKSPKFDDNMENLSFLDTNYGNYRSQNKQKVARLKHDTRGRWRVDDISVEEDPFAKNTLDGGIVFNTLEGFKHNCIAAACENNNGVKARNNSDMPSNEIPGPSSEKWDSLKADFEFCQQTSFNDNFVCAIDVEELSHDKGKNIETLEKPEITPGDIGRMLNLGNALDTPRLQTQSNKYLSLVTLHLPIILRLSVNCPFENVRAKCEEILQMVKDRGLSIPEPVFDGPSAFIPSSELPSLSSLDEKTHMLLMDAFLQNNRLDHISRVMSSHPTYLEHFLKTQHFILRGDGPLSFEYRHLIAIMAAGRHQCSYIINLQKGEFLLQGGDPSWLQGLRSIPNKLQNLYEINKILAHRPWLLNKTHIEKLTKGTDSWSLAEVVHAIVLLAHFHSLSSFVFSCGINEELDNVTSYQYKENIQANSNNVQLAKDKLVSSSPKKIPSSGGKTDKIQSPPSSPSIVGEQEVGVETLMERMKHLSEKSESYQITQEELSKRFESVETQSAELAAAPQRGSFSLDSDIGPFIEDPTFIYQDFAKRGQLNDIPTFRVQDYSWDDHGYSLVNRLYNDVGNLLDDKFKTAYNLTYYTMGTHNKVDTSRFRRAIWNYIQCMFGIRHDDYDYNEVNQLLERSLKTFIKSAVCYPERVTKRDYDRVMKEFKHSEKVHVNLMILEARMQAELLYALRAVMRYMT
ncbi:sestrin-3 isoform X1 [Chelonus insularis]|uniref:sestrin-3 isoform X1 n=1 Tax=Chelonus insularis TaxID=460826 RepID=UPI00158CD464|nr:sestrin-3 isoform X1 [Chelonus insularis]